MAIDISTDWVNKFRHRWGEGRTWRISDTIEMIQFIVEELQPIKQADLWKILRQDIYKEDFKEALSLGQEMKRFQSVYIDGILHYKRGEDNEQSKDNEVENQKTGT